LGLPEFLVIGAAKSGTTSLYEYLRQHPQVFMSLIKETNFFALNGKKPVFAGPDRDFFNHESIYRLEDYKRLFDGRTEEIVAGEASPRYLFTSSTARRIRDFIPEAKLVAILRNPVERAFSAFSMRKRDGWETCKTFEDAILEEEKRLKEGWASGIYLQRGYYGRQLDEYYRVFPREQICVLLYDRMLDDLEGLLTRLFRFIAVDEKFQPDTQYHYNPSGIVKNPVLRFIWTRTHSVQNVLRPLMPKPARQAVSRFFIGLDKEKLSLSAETRELLIDLYRDDILKLEDLIEEDLSSWYRI
jgi:hypothetical protein